MDSSAAYGGKPLPVESLLDEDDYAVMAMEDEDVRAAPRPRLLDLFCGAGGAAVGYHRAGFDVVGVDIAAQPHYPFPFIQADALTFLRTMLHGASEGRWNAINAIHASPPCQRWAAITVKGRPNHPDLITPLRPPLVETGLPWVIENVTAAPLLNPALVCGGATGCVSGDLQLHRHRHFEASFPVFGTGCVTVRPNTVSVVGHGSPSGNRGTLGRNPTIAEKREAMGIDWMNRAELSEAIPPAYTEFIGTQLFAYLKPDAAYSSRTKPEWVPLCRVCLQHVARTNKGWWWCSHCQRRRRKAEWCEVGSVIRGH